MKITKKKVVVTSIAVCLVAILSMGTLAWFTDSDSATNNFFVTNSDQGADAIFSIDVKENVEGSQTPVDGYNFNNILPNQTISKNPYVVNTGSYDQYVRVTITISDYNAFVGALTEHYEIANAFGGINTASWEFDKKIVNDDPAVDTVSYVYYLKTVLAPTNQVELFESVTIPYQLTREDVANTTLSDGFSITVLAEAVQTQNVGVTNETGAAMAKRAFEYVAANS